MTIAGKLAQMREACEYGKLVNRKMAILKPDECLALLDIAVAAQALMHLYRRSLDVGPNTKSPAKEARYCAAIRAALAKLEATP